ncbi:putative nwd2 protein [Mycena sanguinolenta]|uniref:Putative nwd2 protein n=1 Tax=Mycena sanguinolenta TaxID=230812 RepID=A0A8H6WZ55_9AGAR|nr:putative nwd2 protein [Mycena sanguinolenta]
MFPDLQTMNNYIHGGRGGAGGKGLGNGKGGAGGDGMGPSLNFDIRPGGNFTVNNMQQGDRGIEILHRTVSLAAIHDSAESFPQPKCHPETRTKMLGDLRRWALDPDPDTTVLWLYGPAGAGKSAIMQTLGGQLQDAGRLGGCFFFKRGHATRGNGKNLFATIAYQLALTVPWLRTPISQIVANDPSIIVRSITTQMKMLISNLCRTHANGDAVAILIDGLDECEGEHIQVEILRAIRDLSSDHPILLRLIVASRPEPHIREMFNSAVYVGNHHSFNVEQSFEDVRKYLCDEFSRTHRHFIYAATIIKFIDDKNYRPTQRLAFLQDGEKPGSESAFDALDQLYMTILRSTPRQAELVPILCAITNFDLTAADIDQLLDLADGEAALLLRGLHSVLRVPTHKPYSKFISSHHASFLEFLNDSNRSHEFYVGGVDHRMDLARCFLRLGAGQSQPNWSRTFGSRCPQNFIPFITSLPPSAELCPLIACLDLDYIFAQESRNLESMLCWLKMILPVPEDLIELWEDHTYIYSIRTWPGANFKPWLVQNDVSPSPELLRVLVASKFLLYDLRDVCDVLDMPWTKLRAAIQSVRPTIASDEQARSMSPVDFLQELVPIEIQRWTCRDIALICVRKMIDSDVVDGDGMDDAEEWLRLVVLLTCSPPCPILYCEFQRIPRSVMMTHLFGDLFFIRRIFEWLKSFRDPTLELVAFWRQNMLPKERHAECANEPRCDIPNNPEKPQYLRDDSVDLRYRHGHRRHKSIIINWPSKGDPHDIRTVRPFYE